MVTNVSRGNSDIDYRGLSVVRASALPPAVVASIDHDINDFSRCVSEHSRHNSYAGRLAVLFEEKRFGVSFDWARRIRTQTGAFPFPKLSVAADGEPINTELQMLLRWGGIDLGKAEQLNAAKTTIESDGRAYQFAETIWTLPTGAYGDLQGVAYVSSAPGSATLVGASITANLSGLVDATFHIGDTRSLLKEPIAEIARRAQAPKFEIVRDV